MKVLYLLRHAKSDQSDHKVKEKKRPLTKKGERQAAIIGEWMKAKAIMPGLILTSPAIKAMHTAEIVKIQLGYTGEVREVDDLYMAEADEIIDILKKLPDEVGSVMLVGHNPGLESLLPLFTKKVESLPTTTFASLELPIERWTELKHKTRGALVMIQSPKKVGGKKAKEEKGIEKHESVLNKETIHVDQE